MKAGRAVLIASTALIAVLAVLAVVGAFLAHERAAVLFNSPPAAVLWAVLLALTTAGAAVLGVRRRVGWAVAHAGAALVLAGGMLGSPLGHRVVGRLTGRNPIRADVMYVGAGATAGRPVPEQGALAVDDGTTIRIVGRLGRAIGAYADDAEGTLAVLGGDDSIRFVDAAPGRAAELTAPAVTIRIIEVFGNPCLADDGVTIVDRPGPRTNPALRVALTWPDGTTDETLVFARPAPPPRLPAGLRLRYLLAEGPVAVADDASAYPAVQVEVARAGRRGRAWLLADPRWDRLALMASDLPDVGLGDRPAPALVVLVVRSDLGVGIVWAGFVLLCGGVTWAAWIAPLWRRIAGRAA